MQAPRGLSEALHKALEQRFVLALRQAAAARSGDALAAGWRQMRGDERMPGALWATLTHARCDTVLENQVLADVHMLQHQLGAAQRVDLARFEALQAEAGALRAELAACRQRAQQQTGTLQLQLDRAQARGMRQQADAIGRDTALAALRDELQALQAMAPGLQRRAELARRVQAQAERIAELEQALRRARQQAERLLPQPAAAAAARRGRRSSRHGRRPRRWATAPCCASAAARPACRCTGTSSNAAAAASCTTTAATSRACSGSTPRCPRPTW